MANDAVIKIGADVSGAMSGINRISGAMPSLASAVLSGFSIAAVTQFVRASIDAADAMTDLSAKTGLSSETLSGYHRAAQFANVSTEGLGNSFRALSRNMNEGNDAFARYGITTTDASGKLLAIDRVFEQIADKMQQMPDGAEKSALAMDLLGKTGADLIPMLNDGSVGLEMMRLEAERTGNLIGGQFAEDAARFNDNLDELAILARGAGNSIAEYFLPALNGIVEFINARPAERLAEINEELDKLRAEDDYTGFADVRIAKLEEERIALDKIVRLEQQRKALAGSAALGDIRDARDRAGEADRNAPERDRFNAKQKPTKAAKASAAKSGDFGPEISNSEFVKRQGDAEFMGPQISDWDLQIATAAGKEQEKQDAIYDAYKNGLIARGELADEDRLTRDEAEMARMEEAIALQESRYANDLISEQTFQDNINAIKFKAAMTSTSQIAQIQAAAAGWEKFSMIERTKFGLNMAEQLTAGLSGQSRKMFEAHKAASIGQALMNTYEGATKALSQGGIWGAVMMAAVLAIGVAQVAKIRSQKFGGGDSGGGSVGAFPTAASLSQSTTFSQNENGAPPVPVTIGKAEAARTQVNVTLVGSAFDYNTVATQLIPLLNDAAANGAEIRVSQG